MLLFETNESCTPSVAFSIGLVDNSLSSVDLKAKMLFVLWGKNMLEIHDDATIC